MELEHGQTLRLGSQTIRITHPDKLIFPDDGITKGDLIEYYERVAPWIIPHLRGRPLAIQRYPGGIGVRGFFQQAVSPYFPDWLPTVTVPKQGGTVKHAVCDNTADLVYLANQAMVTPHIWLSRKDGLNEPDLMVFDLDPSGAGFDAVKDAARRLKSLLDELGLPAFLKTTGSHGLHVAVPLKRKATFDQLREFARMLAEVAVARDPGQWTIEQRKDKRHNRVYIDTNRNAYGQTIAPAYAVRSRAGAPVSVPISWEELEGPSLAPDRWTIRNVFEKLESCDDPWKDIYRHGASLDRARARLEEVHAAEGVPQEKKVRRNTGTRRRAA